MIINNHDSFFLGVTLQVKDRIMQEAVLAKFTQHRDIRKILLSTGDAILIEHTDRDSYWGDGGGI